MRHSGSTVDPASVAVSFRGRANDFPYQSHALRIFRLNRGRVGAGGAHLERDAAQHLQDGDALRGVDPREFRTTFLREPFDGQRPNPNTV